METRGARSFDVSRRGLTLVELLAAIAILAAIMAAMSSLTMAASRIQTTVSSSVNWETSASALFSLIKDDLGSGDLGVDDRVVIEQGVLRIKSRSRAETEEQRNGPAMHVYRLDGKDLVRGRLDLDAAGTTLLGVPGPSRLLVGDVANWNVSVVEDDAQRILTVELGSLDGERLTRTFDIP